MTAPVGAPLGSSLTVGRLPEEVDTPLCALRRRAEAPAGVRVSGRGTNGLLCGQYGAWLLARGAFSLGVPRRLGLLSRVLGSWFSVSACVSCLRARIH